MFLDWIQLAYFQRFHCHSYEKTYLYDSYILLIEKKYQVLYFIIDFKLFKKRFYVNSICLYYIERRSKIKKKQIVC